MTRFAVVFDGAAHILYVEDRSGPPYWRLARRQNPDTYHVSGPGGSRVLSHHPVLRFPNEKEAAAYAQRFLGEGCRQVPPRSMRRFWQGHNVVEEWSSRKESFTLSVNFTVDAVTVPTNGEEDGSESNTGL